MTPSPSFLEALKLATECAARAENDFRRDVAERAKMFESERAFAFRRLNLMRAIADATAGAEDEEIAVARALAVLRAKLGWSSDSETRDIVASRFAPVAQATFASLSVDGAPREGTDVLATLAAFERWYAATHPNPFWALFENYMPETPVVDF